MSGPKLAILVPSMGTWAGDFGYSLCRLSWYLGQHQGFESVGLYHTVSSLLPSSRQHLLEEAIEGGATHALFLDSDMTFPPDTAHRLLRHGRPIVAAAYPRKQVSLDPVVAVAEDAELEAEATRHGLLEVEKVGMGVMLIDLSVPKKMAKPWFLISWEDDDFVSEDYYFVRKAREAGFPAYVDVVLSKEIGHIGTYEYAFEGKQPLMEPVNRLRGVKR